MLIKRYSRPFVGPVLGILAAFMAVPSAQAQVLRYECRAAHVDGVSGPERNNRVAAREARTAWEAAARSQFRFNYRWQLAQEIPAQTYTRSQAGRVVGRARAYPCRVYVGLPRGTLTTSDTSASEIVCMGFPTLAEAQQHGCAMFYPLRRYAKVGDSASMMARR